MKRVRVNGAWWVVVFVLAVSGCTESDRLGSASAAVLNGEPSTDDGVVFLIGGDINCGAALVGDRWVLTLSSCISGAGAMGAQTNSDDFVPAAMVHIGPVAPSTLGADETRYVLMELESPLDEAVLSSSDVTPSVDDVLTVIGYGSDTPSASDKTRGGFRLAGIAMDGTWHLEGTDDLEVCTFDAIVVDDAGALMALVAYYYDPDMGPLDGCGPALGAAPLSEEVRTFIAETMASRPDAGVPADSGAGDAGASLDAGTGMDSGSDDGGCRVGGGSAPLGALILAGAVLLGLRRRRR